MTDRSTVVQNAMERAGLDTLLVAAPANIAYICGFRTEPHERLIALVLPQAGEPRLVCPSLEEEAARGAFDGAVRLHVWRDEEGPGGALADALAGAARIGIEKRYLSVADAELAAAAAPAATFAGCDELLARLRAVKSDDEIAALRRAAGIVDGVVAHLAAAAAPGVTEAGLAAECVQRLLAAGGDSPAFDPLILTGPRSALPHSRSSATAIAEGDLLIIDIGVVADGYCADITRTVVVGSEPDDRQREVFETVLAAQRAAIEVARAGTPARAVDDAARGLIADRGYGANFVHRTGHGLGLELHEPPYLTAASDEPLQPGMVVTVEPGVYVEGWGGVRIEDDIVIGESGADVLTRAPIDLSAAEVVHA